MLSEFDFKEGYYKSVIQIMRSVLSTSYRLPGVIHDQNYRFFCTANEANAYFHRGQLFDPFFFISETDMPCKRDLTQR